MLIMCVSCIINSAIILLCIFSVSGCPTGWFGSNFAGKCYRHYVLEEVTVEDAKSRCTEEGGQLAHPTSDLHKSLMTTALHEPSFSSMAEWHHFLTNFNQILLPLKWGLNIYLWVSIWLYYI